jgi:hypothetical protein
MVTAMWQRWLQITVTSRLITNIHLTSVQQPVPSYLPNGRIGPMCGEIGLLVIPKPGIRWDS